MGNQQSLDPPIEHSRISKVQYSKAANYMLVREPILSKTKVQDQWASKNKLMKHIYDHPSILFSSHFQFEESSTCSDSAIFVGKYQGIYESTLKDDLAARTQLNNKFTEQEIWFFVLFATKCADHLYSFGDKHLIGNIHPYNILLSKKGDYKLVVTNYSISLPNQLDHFKEYRLHGDSRAFISPELIGFLYSSKYSQYPQFPRCVDKQLAESFCLGMTLLSMATLKVDRLKIYKSQDPIMKNRNSKINNLSSSSRLKKQKVIDQSSLNQSEQIPLQYNKSLADLINHQLLQELLAIVKDKYSDILYNIIIALIYPNPEVRIRLDKLYKELLYPVQKLILAYDFKWIYQSKQNNYQFSNLEGQAREICSKWVRQQSQILKQ